MSRDSKIMINVDLRRFEGNLMYAGTQLSDHMCNLCYITFFDFVCQFGCI